MRGKGDRGSGRKGTPACATPSGSAQSWTPDPLSPGTPPGLCHRALVWEGPSSPTSATGSPRVPWRCPLQHPHPQNSLTRLHPGHGEEAHTGGLGRIGPGRGGANFTESSRTCRDAEDGGRKGAPGEEQNEGARRAAGHRGWAQRGPGRAQCKQQQPGPGRAREAGQRHLSPPATALARAATCHRVCGRTPSPPGAP